MMTKADVFFFVNVRLLDTIILETQIKKKVNKLRDATRRFTREHNNLSILESRGF